MKRMIAMLAMSSVFCGVYAAYADAEYRSTFGVEHIEKPCVYDGKIYCSYAENSPYVIFEEEDGMLSRNETLKVAYN